MIFHSLHSKNNKSNILRVDFSYKLNSKALNLNLFFIFLKFPKRILTLKIAIIYSVRKKIVIIIKNNKPGVSIMVLYGYDQSTSTPQHYCNRKRQRNSKDEPDKAPEVETKRAFYWNQ
jgi:hypothetical protein